MLSDLQQQAAVALSHMSVPDREEALKRGHIMIKIIHGSGSGGWTPVNLDADVVAAAHKIFFSEAGDAGNASSGSPIEIVIHPA